uniref:Potassium voltage-gated channel subfamily H member 2-like n=1 Tax=Callorhinchus milii TaxID=7868 RepID=A0A4W3H4S0_CALMI
MSLSQQSLAKEGFEGTGIDYLKPDSETLALKDLGGTVNENCFQPDSGEMEALIELERRSQLDEAFELVDLPSPPQRDRDPLDLDAQRSSSNPTRLRFEDSFQSMRRASSVDNIEAMRSELEKKFKEKTGSGGSKPPKPNLLNSTSDSDLMKYRTISKIPQITLNFVDFNPDAILTPSPTEIEIIAPSKVKERTQNVTEKVTQVPTPPP